MYRITHYVFVAAIYLHFSCCVRFYCMFRFSIFSSPAAAAAKYCDEYVWLWVCLSVYEDISKTVCAIYANFVCVLPMSVARSSSGMLAIGRIAYRRERALFPTDNALYSIAFGTHTKTAKLMDMPFDMMSRLGRTNVYVFRMATETWVTRPTSVCLFGHSYICRLGEYMEKQQQTQNLGFKPSDVIINSTGMEVATAFLGRKRIQNDIRKLLQCWPEIVYLHTGENDLRSGQGTNISSSIIELVSILSERVSLVIVSQLLLFPVNRSK